MHNYDRKTLSYLLSGFQEINLTTPQQNPLLRKITPESTKDRTCSYCGYVATYKSGLISHIRTHTGERPFVCRYCGKAFAQKQNFRVHEGLHETNKILMCKICNDCFRSEASLAMHAVTHKGTFNP